VGNPEQVLQRLPVLRQCSLLPYVPLLVLAARAACCGLSTRNIVIYDYRLHASSSSEKCQTFIKKSLEFIKAG